MSFQVSDDKGQHFLELLDSDSKPIEPLYSKGGPWLKFFGYSNLLYTRASRVIVNYTSIGKYWLRFFPWEEFNVHVISILLKQNDTFFINIEDITTIRIQEGI